MSLNPIKSPFVDGEIMWIPHESSNSESVTWRHPASRSFRPAPTEGEESKAEGAEGAEGHLGWSLDPTDGGFNHNKLGISSMDDDDTWYLGVSENGVYRYTPQIAISAKKDDICMIIIYWNRGYLIFRHSHMVRTYQKKQFSK